MIKHNLYDRSVISCKYFSSLFFHLNLGQQRILNLELPNPDPQMIAIFGRCFVPLSKNSALTDTRS